MKKNKISKVYIMKDVTVRVIAVFLGIMSIIMGCKEDEDETMFTDESSLLITAYINSEQDLQHMSELLEKGGLDVLLNTYGSYTVLAPSDSAFEEYFSSLGIENVDGLDTNQVKELLDFHIIFNSVILKAQNTGLLGLGDTTVSGIRHFVDLSQGIDHIVLNKTALVNNTAEVSNGIVYSIDEVLVPHPDNIYDYLIATGEFTIMAEAIAAAGLKDTLQKIEQPYVLSDIPGASFIPDITLFVEPDEVLINNGITSLPDLENSAWSNNKGQAGDKNEALVDFVKYHLISGRRTTFNMYKNENLNTFARNGSTIIHVDESPDPRQPVPVLNSPSGGTTLNYSGSDVSFINGLVHQLEGVLYIDTNYIQAEVICECEDGISVVPTSSFYGYLIVYEDVKIGGRGEITNITNNQQFSSSTYDDQGMAITFTPVDEGDWIEFIIRNVVSGTYKVLFNYQRDKLNSSQNINVYFRNLKDEFSWKTQLFMAGLDMADRNDVVNYPDYRQNQNLGTIDVSEFGDYVFRFAHVDIYSGIYDNIILEPVF
jgi:uncharacterized surface protein with fasciclin (FAS1) repeats